MTKRCFTTCVRLVNAIDNTMIKGEKTPVLVVAICVAVVNPGLVLHDVELARLPTLLADDGADLVVGHLVAARFDACSILEAESSKFDFVCSAARTPLVGGSPPFAPFSNTAASAVYYWQRPKAAKRNGLTVPRTLLSTLPDAAPPPLGRHHLYALTMPRVQPPPRRSTSQQNTCTTSTKA